MVDTYILCAWHTTYLFSLPSILYHGWFFWQSFVKIYKYTNTFCVLGTQHICLAGLSCVCVFYLKVFVKISNYTNIQVQINAWWWIHTFWLGTQHICSAFPAFSIVGGFFCKVFVEIYKYTNTFCVLGTQHICSASLSILCHVLFLFGKVSVKICKYTNI